MKAPKWGFFRFKKSEGGEPIGNLKLLFITKEFSSHIEKSTLYLIEELKKEVDLMIWSTDAHIETILKEVPFTPDYILLNDHKFDYCPEIHGLKNCGIPCGIIMHDLQYKRSTRKRFIERENIQHIFSIYRDKFIEWYPEYVPMMTWLPHHVPTSIFKDYQLNKDTNFLLMGSIYKELYPLRAFIVDQLKNDPGFVCHPHPGYSLMDHKKEGYKIQEEYAMEINRSHMFFTCDSNYHFPVLKYFEVLGCRTLLLASGSKELVDLGFIDGETFVEINQNNVIEKAYYYLSNQQLSGKIIQKGAHLIETEHSTKVRAKQLIQKIESLINK